MSTWMIHLTEHQNKTKIKIGRQESILWIILYLCFLAETEVYKTPEVPDISYNKKQIKYI